MTAPPRLHQELAHLAGTAADLDPAPDIELDGRALAAALAPRNAEQAAEAVERCAAQQAVVVPAGGRTLWSGLRAPGDDRPAVMLSMRRMDGIIDHAAGDWTITVQAGLPLAELDRVTAGHGQCLPICVPQPGDVTVGGLLASNPADPCRRLHGVLSDHVLGGEMILADGRRIKSGARTVKSVAGYDLHKLVIGGRGALGLITQVTLRLYPRPAGLGILIAAPQDVDAALAGGFALLGGRTRPAAVEIAPPSDASALGLEGTAGRWALLAAFAGPHDAVDWQLQEAARDLPVVATTRNDPARAVLRRIADFPGAAGGGAFEIEIERQHCAALLACCAANRVPAIADFGSRVVRGRYPADSDGALLGELQEAAGPRAQLRLEGPAAEAAVQAGGLEPPGRRWMRALKRELDPQGVFPTPAFLREPEVEDEGSQPQHHQARPRECPPAASGRALQ